MKEIIDKIIIVISSLFIGFALIFSFIPNLTLNAIVTLGCFFIPMLIILIATVIETKKEKDKDKKEQIRNFWFKKLFIIYFVLLITILFLNNEYRIERGFGNVFSKEYFELSNIIPFATIISYINRLIDHNINTNIVILNFIVNLSLFAPMGFFTPILFKDRIKNTKQFILMIIIFTGIVEVIQFLTYRGSTDIDDIILNTLGAVIVYLLMKTKFVKSILRKVFDIT